MTREQAKAMLPFITAYANGKTIQHDYGPANGGWRDLSSPHFCATDVEHYRIKPIEYKIGQCFQDEESLMMYMLIAKREPGTIVLLHLRTGTMVGSVVTGCLQGKVTDTDLELMLPNTKLLPVSNPFQLP